MPLNEVNQIRHVCASIRLDEATAAQVDQYAAFIHASADDVVDKALHYLFSQDRDFQEFLKTPQARQVPSALRVRKAPNNGASEESVKRPARGMEVTPSAWALKARSGVRFRGGIQRCFAPAEFRDFTLSGNCPNTLVPRQMSPETQELKNNNICRVPNSVERSEIPND